MIVYESQRCKDRGWKVIRKVMARSRHAEIERLHANLDGERH